jgi:hypothetical protein
MRKALQNQIRPIFVGVAAIIALATLVDAKPAIAPEQESEIANCSRNVGAPASDQLWESLSQQFISTVSCN